MAGQRRTFGIGLGHDGGDRSADVPGLDWYDRDCPTLRYNPAVVAETFASLSHLCPGRIFLGVGSGEALNEQAATGNWPKWQETWDRLIEAMQIIRDLWSGRTVARTGQNYTAAAITIRPCSRFQFWRLQMERSRCASPTNTATAA